MCMVFFILYHKPFRMSYFRQQQQKNDKYVETVLCIVENVSDGVK